MCADTPSKHCTKLLIFPYKIDKSSFALLSEEGTQEASSVFTRCSLPIETRLKSRVWFGKGPQELSGEWYGMMYLDSYQVVFVATHLNAFAQQPRKLRSWARNPVCYRHGGRYVHYSP